jgi:hypothetical protein
MRSDSDVFLPVSFNRLNLWPGHRPGICMRLHLIQDRAALRPGGLSLAERALFAVCELWSAVSTQSLALYLGADPEGRLRSLAAVYAAMGAKRTARVMEQAFSDLQRTRNERLRRVRIAALEVALLKWRGSVDEQIGRFADRLLPPASVFLQRAVHTAPTIVAPLAARPVILRARSLPLPPPASYVRWRTENHGAERQD